MAEQSIEGATILITGGAGFIGSHIADALVETNEVRVLDDLSTGSRENVPPAATFIEGDLRDEELLREATTGVDIIFHEAAVVSVEESVRRPEECHSINVDATITLLERARDEDARVILASSTAIYGEPEQTPVSETAPKRPQSPYGIDKATIDRYARVYHDLYELDTVALRYFNVYGPRQTAGDYSGVIGIFIEQAHNGNPLTVHGDGEQTRDFVHVRDVVQANLRAATTENVGQAYNVGTGEVTSINDLAEHIRDLTDTESKITHTSARAGDVRHSCADLSRAKRELGYQPQTSLKEGLLTLVK